ncbi:MAG: RNA-binding protein hfq [Oscillatoria sp. PMC 1051.18]|uniref:Hfq-related RNA-binding protein n=1 Tax=Oscillatoria salina TaxID=331517 RepID=UPI0013B91F31|nr:RNA-binding protein hfq [Oscillatoria salina]MBZ8181597.1 RNA-binding protein hfq [Oscillatoria salina IIICB1]MEC4891618.1 RNA-binding protein hfq [Oscillatoria sp. PMC 1050.18]MEC5030441.1 RNA-binding protein hfq [Oscillatoria sp. PMC 1051.18]NET89833.1 RNA-binding protein hfq [Kamptonema sp. SIO1D9]
MTQLDTHLPGTRYIQGYIRDEKQVHLKLITNDILTGKILWQDPECLCLMNSEQQQMLIWRTAIAYLVPQE